MRISSKARYGMAAMIYLAECSSEDVSIPILSISESLGISKIYLEQVFSLLKRAELVISSKGSQGGYKLSRNAEDISAYDILSAIEVSLFEKTEKSVCDNAEYIEKSLSDNLWEKLDLSIEETLKAISLQTLVTESLNNKSDTFMFFI